MSKWIIGTAVALVSPSCKFCDAVPYAEIDGLGSTIELKELASGVTDDPAMIRVSIEGGPEDETFESTAELERSVGSRLEVVASEVDVPGSCEPFTAEGWFRFEPGAGWTIDGAEFPPVSAPLHVEAGSSDSVELWRGLSVEMRYVHRSVL